jgi:hypothetical protein
MSQLSLIKPLNLFTATWDESDLVKLSADDDEAVVGDVTNTFFQRTFNGTFRTVTREIDLYGIDWSTIHKSAYDRDVRSSYEKISKFDNAYLRLTLTVENGRFGDSMLFLFNHPNTSVGSGINSAVSLTVTSESTDGASDGGFTFGSNVSAKRTVVVDQFFTGDWDLARYSDGDAALNRMQQVTKVRFLGLSKQDGIRIEASCSLLGGMADQRVI